MTRAAWKDAPGGPRSCRPSAALLCGYSMVKECEVADAPVSTIVTVAV